MMNSKYLPPAVTRRWFKPRTFTADPRANAVGAPWEIFRQVTTGRTIDFYTKGGDYGAYGSSIVLIPEYNFGFTVLTAAADDFEGDAVIPISNIIADVIMPALENAARGEANSNFAGKWMDAKSNSSVTIASDEWPALKVTEFVVNGFDQYSGLLDEADNGPSSWRIQPNELFLDGTHVGFTGIISPTIDTGKKLGYFDTPCGSWYNTGGETLHSLDATAFTFEVDANGNGVSLVSPAWEVTMYRA